MLTPLASLHGLDVAEDYWQALSPIERGRRIQQAVPHLFETIAASRPVAIIAEDLHWIDPESQDVLVRLASLVTAENRILVLTTFRLEYSPPWAEMQRTVPVMSSYPSIR